MDKLAEAFRQGFKKEAQSSYVGKMLGLSDDVAESVGQPFRQTFGTDKDRLVMEAQESIKDELPDSAFNLSSGANAARTDEIDRVVEDLSRYDADTLAEATKNRANDWRAAEARGIGAGLMDAGAATGTLGGVGTLTETTGMTDMF